MFGSFSSPILIFDLLSTARSVSFFSVTASNSNSSALNCRSVKFLSPLLVRLNYVIGLILDYSLLSILLYTLLIFYLWISSLMLSTTLFLSCSLPESFLYICLIGELFLLLRLTSLIRLLILLSTSPIDSKGEGATFDVFPCMIEEFANRFRGLPFSKGFYYDFPSCKIHFLRPRKHFIT